MKCLKSAFLLWRSSRISDIQKCPLNSLSIRLYGTQFTIFLKFFNGWIGSEMVSWVAFKNFASVHCVRDKSDQMKFSFIRLLEVMRRLSVHCLWYQNYKFWSEQIVDSTALEIAYAHYLFLRVNSEFLQITFFVKKSLFKISCKYCFLTLLYRFSRIRIVSSTMMYMKSTKNVV